MDGPICGDALRASGTHQLSNNPGGLGNPQETFPALLDSWKGLLRDYTGRDCDVQDIVQPANPETGGQGKPDAGC